MDQATKNIAEKLLASLDKIGRLLDAKSQPAHRSDQGDSGNGRSVKRHPGRHGWKRGWKRSKPFLEIFVAGAVITYTWVSYLQWKDLQANFAADRRAWIAFDYGEIAIADDAKIAIPLRFSNTGKTPAKHVELHVRGAVVERHEELTARFFHSDHLRLTAKVEMLVPNHQQDVPFAMPDIRDSIAELKAGTKLLLIYGDATYGDVFREHHWIHFCYQVRMRQLDSLHAAAEECAAYNDSDDGK